MKFNVKGAFAASAAAGLIALSTLANPAFAAAGDTLKAIQDRGHLLCPGHNGSYPPFAIVSDDNK